MGLYAKKSLVNTNTAARRPRTTPVEIDKFHSKIRTIIKDKRLFTIEIQTKPMKTVIRFNKH